MVSSDCINNTCFNKFSLTENCDSLVSDGRCRQNPSSHAHVAQSLLVSPAHRTFFLLTHAGVWLKGQLDSSLELTVLKLSACLLKKHLHLHAMSLLGVPHTSSSFCSTPPFIWTPTPATLTGIRIPPRAAPRLRGQSDHLDNTTQSTAKRSQPAFEENRENTISGEQKECVRKETHAVSATMRVEVKKLRALPLLL